MMNLDEVLDDTVLEMANVEPPLGMERRTLARVIKARRRHPAGWVILGSLAASGVLAAMLLWVNVSAVHGVPRRASPASGSQLVLPIASVNSQRSEAPKKRNAGIASEPPVLGRGRSLRTSGSRQIRVKALEIAPLKIAPLDVGPIEVAALGIEQVLMKGEVR